MSEWKTVRVRADRLAEVKARAGAEGTNATAWIDDAIGRRLNHKPPPELAAVKLAALEAESKGAKSAAAILRAAAERAA